MTMKRGSSHLCCNRRRNLCEVLTSFKSNMIPYAASYDCCHQAPSVSGYKEILLKLFGPFDFLCFFWTLHFNCDFSAWPQASAWPPHPPPPHSPRLQRSGTTRAPSHVPTHIHKMRSGSVAELGQDVMHSNVPPSRLLSTAPSPGFK